ncbi:DIS3-like exonuclease 2 isoform X2 [Paramacrobiotus metropolitanus]|uniref:DIS3-like exonuclease 2 isoform X2 n=1 Tax=Paramacrobiotus metropolitanus TaxID=2943436 RepID=UPI0024461CC3|nr:DIS3-like exonuclease 2 isoform X2 [Paramacrobiotus metropolitanus]
MLATYHSQLNQQQVVRGTLVVVGPELAFVHVQGQDDDVLISGLTNRKGALNGDQVDIEYLPTRDWTPKLEYYWDEIAQILRITSLGTAFLKDDLRRLVSTAHGTYIPKLQFMSSQTIQQKWMQLLQACNWIPRDYFQSHLFKKAGKVKTVLSSSAGIEKAVGQLHSPERGSLTVVYNLKPTTFRTTWSGEKIPKELIDAELLGKMNSSLVYVEFNKNLLNGSKTVSDVGQTENLTTWIKAILLENGISSTKLDSLSPPENLQLANQIEADRRDLSDLVVFTIDPPSSVDIDDALSCIRLPNGNLQIGVHIADVSHFIQEGSPVDKEARARGASLFLQNNKVIHMLPEGFVQRCSLLPAVPRYAVSVLYEVTLSGHIINTSKFFKSLICSRARLTYQQAHALIDREREYSPSELKMDVTKVTVNQDYKSIVESLRDLDAATQCLRAIRFNRDKPIRIEGMKSQSLYEFQLTNGNMVQASKLQEYRSEQLIEELAILTNYTAAREIYTKFPNNCLLRHHPGPNRDALQLLKKNCKLLGLDIDVGSRDGLHGFSDGNRSRSVNAAFFAMLVKSFKKEEYVRPANGNYSHYALGMEYYTHATSPIRRYADIVVHRMLFNSRPFDANTLDDVIKTCNQRTAAVKNSQGDDWTLCLGWGLKQNIQSLRQPQLAVVVGIYPAEFTLEVLIVEYAVRRKILPRKDPNVRGCSHSLGTVRSAADHILNIDWRNGRRTAVSVWDEIKVMLTFSDGIDPRNFKILLVEG